jgi:hypothetical protein
MKDPIEFICKQFPAAKTIVLQKDSFGDLDLFIDGVSMCDLPNVPGEVGDAMLQLDKEYTVFPEETAPDPDTGSSLEQWTLRKGGFETN